MMDVRMPDGKIVKNVPEGTSKEALLAKYNSSVSQEFPTDDTAANMPTQDSFAPTGEQTRVPGTPENPQGSFTGAVRAMFNGTTYGFGTELEAGAKSLLGADYQDTYDEIEAQKRQTASSDPYKQGTLELLSGGATGVGTLKALEKATRPLTFKEIVALGAAEGGVAGYGSGEQGNRGKNAVVSATAGAVLPFAVPTIAKTAGAVANTVKRFINKADPQKEVVGFLDKMLRKGGVRTDEVGRNIDEFGDQTTLATSLAEPGATATKYAVKHGDDATKEAARDLLADNLSGGVSRTVNDIEKITGVSNTKSLNAKNIAESTMKTNADKHYRDAYKVPFKQTKEIKELLKLKSTKKAFKEAIDLYEEEVGKKVQYKTTRKQQGYKMVDSKEPIITTELADYIKRGFKGLIEGKKGTKVNGQKTEQGRAWSKTRNAWNEAIREQNSHYRLATDTFSDDLSMLTARDKGLDFLKTTTSLNDAKSWWKELSPGEQKMARGGAIEYLTELAGKKSEDAMNILAAIKNQNTTNKLKMMFGGDQAKKIDGILRREVGTDKQSKVIAQGLNVDLDKFAKGQVETTPISAPNLYSKVALAVTPVTMALKRFIGQGMSKDAVKQLDKTLRSTGGDARKMLNAIKQSRALSTKQKAQMTEVIKNATAGMAVAAPTAFTEN